MTNHSRTQWLVRTIWSPLTHPWVNETQPDGACLECARVLTADGSCVLLKKRHTGAPHNCSWGGWWWPAISHIQPLPALGRASSHPSSPAVAGYLHCYRVANCPSKAYPQMKLQGPLRPGLGVCAIPSTASSWMKTSPGSMEVKEGLWSLGFPHAGFSRPHCVTAVFLKNVFSVSFFFFPSQHCWPCSYKEQIYLVDFDIFGIFDSSLYTVIFSFSFTYFT